MKSYETTDRGGRVVCKEHGSWRCSDCAYVAELEAEVFRLQDELNGDGVLTLSEQVSHAKDEIRRQDDLISELYSIALWCARRMMSRQYAEFAYDEIEKVTGEKVDREWGGEQV